MKRRRKTEPDIFKGIRKPTAPPAKRFGDDRPPEKVHPAKRKVKHKKGEVDGDI